ncbi:MAG: flavin monoamine oxidase family protein [Lysobacterales bacterium]
MSRHQFTRRQLLGGASAALAAAPWAHAASPSPAIPDVLVLGAGLSGLYSALLLEDSGARVQVLEGQSRVGGRIYTRFDLPGHPEVGGNTMGAGYGRMLNMAKRFKIPLMDYGPRMFAGPPPQLVVGGSMVSSEQWPSSPKNPFGAPLNAAKPWEFLGRRLAGSNPLAASTDWLTEQHRDLDVPLHQYLAAQGVSDREIQMSYDVNPYFGKSAWDVSALMYLFTQKWTQEQIAIGRGLFTVKGGNQKLPQAMADALKSEVKLNQSVMAIDVGKSGVEVTTADGTVHKARRVISSLPLSKLRDIDIRPGIVGAQRQAIRTIAYMRNTLIFLVPKKPFWEEDGISPSMWTNGLLGTVMAQKFADDPSEVTGLVVNARGWGADRLDRMGPVDAPAAAIREIERLRPAAKGQLEVGGFHSWWMDPYAAGDWAIFGAGQVSNLVPDMAKPHQLLHFCGEHAAKANRGMEGAMESAEQAVMEVLTSL